MQGDKHVPSGWDSIGTMIPSLHSLRRSDTIGHKNCWILSRFYSFGPGIMLMHRRFDVQYLENKCRE